MKVTILGCGSSAGVPLIGCKCSVCTSNDPKNRRTRVSVALETQNTRILFDTSPDLREQALKADISSVDAVLFTHDHADHTHGIDDTRSFNYHADKPLDIYGTAEVLGELRTRFSYVFSEGKGYGHWTKPGLVGHEIGEYEQFSVKDLTFRSFLQCHGSGKSLGYRVGNFAYSTDVNNLPDKSFQLLESLELWVVDCLRPEPAPTHAHLEMTLGWIARLKPKRAILTHMAHEMEYNELCQILPPGVEPGYDGLVIDLT